MSWRVTTEPVTEPVSLTEAKLHLRVDSTADDDLITTLISVARQWCEGFQNRAYITQTITMTLDKFPKVFKIPKPPLQSVSSIKYIDTGGNQQTFAAANYDVDVEKEPGRIALAYSKSWPSIRGDINSVEVVYIAGYATKFTASKTDDKLTVSGRTFADANIVRLSTTGGDLQAGLATYTDYHVRDVDGQTLKLAETAGGDAIDITEDADSNATYFIGCVPTPIIQAIKLMVNHLYEHREAVSDLAIKEVPMTVKSLLSMDRA